MDEMDAFERQVAGVVRQATRLPRPVDAMAIVRSVTATTPGARFHGVLSVARFLVAGAVVALFGAFLLTGTLTQRRDGEPLPGAVASASAAPTPQPSSAPTEPPQALVARTDLLPGVSLIIEDVEPGVLRIVGDGVRELRWVPTRGEPRQPYCCYYQNAIGIAPDGTPLFFRPEGFFRLGSDQTYPSPFDGDPHGSVVVSGRLADGRDERLWFIRDRQLQVVDPDADPATRAIRPARWVATDPSGIIWSVAGRRGSATVLARSDDDGTTWTRRLVPEPAGPISGLWAADDGAVWLQSARTLLRYDGHDWQDVQIPLIGEGTHRPPVVDIGGDGTVWVLRSIRDPDGSGPADDRDQWARWQDGRWTMFEIPGEIPKMSRPHDGGAHFEVAPDGSLWLNPALESVGPAGDCDGLARFDGADLHRFLPGLCIYNHAIGPDGSVWVLAGADYWKEENPPLDTYMIPAEVAMAEG